MSKKRGMFSRILGINLITLLICLIVLGSMQSLLITRYFTRYNEDLLTENAETLINLINRNISNDDLNGLVSAISRVSGTYIFIFDSKGEVIASTADSSLVKYKPMYLNQENIKTVLSGEKYSGIGTMGGVFINPMYTLQMPVVSLSGQVLGGVSLSKPIPEQQKMQRGLYRILLMSMLVIALTSLMLSYFFARRLSVPIRNISNTTKAFAKGDFKTRVDTSAKNSDIYEISELAEAFNNMAEELEKSEEIKNTFISDVSHELRTPMTTISGFVSGMLDDTIPPEKHKEYLNIVYSEVNRLSRLVNTFLDITRLQSDKMVLNMQTFDINEVIRIVLIGLECKINEKNINVNLDFDGEKCYAYADKDSITRVVTNIIDNAIKFTDESGEISVTVKQKHNVTVSVKNTGAGIPEDKLSMIFKRFYKEDKSRSINKEGTGIGLYLVKNILSAHGQNIKVNSVEGEYAEFVFTLDKSRKNI